MDCYRIGIQGVSKFVAQRSEMFGFYCDYCGKPVNNASLERIVKDENNLMQCKACNQRLFKGGKTQLRM